MTLDEAIAVLNGDKELICFHPFLGGDMAPESISCCNKLAYDADCTAIDAMRELKRYREISTVEGCRKAMRIAKERSEQEGQRWIPVSERLPEDLEDVLVWFEYFRYGGFNRLHQTIGISYTLDGKWSAFVNGFSGWKDLRIIAWMPLPMPYKEEQTCRGKIDEDI